VKTIEFLVEECSDSRLDVYLAQRLPDLSRSGVGRLIERDCVLVNGRCERASYRVRPGDRITVTILPPEPTDITPEDIPLDVLYEDDQVIVINKAKGMVVHPAPGSKRGTLVNAILAHSDSLSGVGGEERPGIVHRLDKDTSGVLITAKNPVAHEHLARQFKDRRVRKLYLAIVRGAPAANRGRIEGNLARSRSDRTRFTTVASGGRTAVTDYRVLRRYEAVSLVLLAPRTGRTHQLRVHLRLVGSPALGDPLYGGRDPRFPGATLMLHAWRLRLRLPGQEQEREFRAPLPARFRSLLRSLKASRPGTG